MRCIRDAFFDKALSPIKRLSLVWEVVFFLRIWRLWLYKNGYSEADHFITQNASICIELNSHLVVNVICNVINGHFPKESLRFWTYGSQACEQAFRLLRSMTSTFSTIVNFSLKGNVLFVFDLNFYKLFHIVLNRHLYLLPLIRFLSSLFIAIF